MPYTPTHAVPTPTMADLLVALSKALDVAARQPSGHAIRTCAIGMKIGKHLEMPDDKLIELYYSLLLKDCGASSASARLCSLFATNEIDAQREYRMVDWTNSVEAANYIRTHGRRDEPLFGRMKRVVRAALDPSALTKGIMRDQAIGAEHALKQLGFGPQILEGVRCIDERWDGSGGPLGLANYSIPLVSRIVTVASIMDLYATTRDVTAAYDVIAQRCWKWYDPEVVAAARTFRDEPSFWGTLQSQPRRALRIHEGATLDEPATDERIESVCRAFGKIVDAKSPYTRGHSIRVSQCSVEIGRALDLDAAHIRTLRRAALLHDIGKLNVPNAILEKPQKLTDTEWKSIRNYPEQTEQLLTPIKGFRRLAEIACSHNERIDGRGYHKGMRGEQLDLAMRIIAVADVYEALTSDRPQRAALPYEKVFAILDKDAGIGLDAACIDVLKQQYRTGSLMPSLTETTAPPANAIAA